MRPRRCPTCGGPFPYLDAATSAPASIGSTAAPSVIGTAEPDEPSSSRRAVEDDLAISILPGAILGGGFAGGGSFGGGGASGGF